MPETASRPVPKIASLKTFAVRMPFVDGGAGTGGTPSRWHELDMVLVRVEDEDGHVGWGEAFAYFLSGAGEGRCRAHDRSLRCR